MPAPLREQTACRSSAQGTKPAHDGREREFPLQPGPSVKRYTARRPVENVIRAGPDSDSQQSGVSIGAFEQGRRALLPPMHMVTTPERAFWRAISLAMVPTMREPVIPNG